MCGGGGDGPSAPLWIVSFADMVANLLTFFIILACFADSGTGGAPSVVQAGVGVHGTQQKQPAPDMVQRAKSSDAIYGTEGPRTPSERMEEALDTALDKLATPAEYDVKPDLQQTSTGVRIRLSAEGMFRPGSTSMTEHGLVLVREIGTFFRGEACDYTVEGHTDLQTGDTREALLERSLQMARGVARALGGAGVEPFRVGLCPQGAAFPVDSNDTAAGRRRNRRVEIVVRKQS